MDLKDFFDRDHDRHKQRYRDHQYDNWHDGGRHREHDDYPYERGYHHERRDHGYRPPGRHNEDNDDHNDMLDFSHITHQLLANKNLLILAGAVLLVVIVLLGVFVLPLLGKALPLLGQTVEYADKIGLKGVMDRIWQGAAGGK